MTTPNVIGVLGQPGRIKPADLDEILTAVHEAAHGVFAQVLPGMNVLGNFAQVLPGMNVLGKIQLWEGELGVNGFCGPTESEARPTFDEKQDYGLLPIDATIPLKWQAEAKDVWANSLCCFAGGAAQLVYQDEDISASSVRWNPTAGYDLEIAEKTLYHYFAPEHVGDLLNKSAELAGFMCCIPPVWRAICDLSNFLLTNARYQSSMFETSVLVRAHIPMPWTSAPGEDWAMRFVRKQA